MGSNLGKRVVRYNYETRQEELGTVVADDAPGFRIAWDDGMDIDYDGYNQLLSRIDGREEVRVFTVAGM